MQNNCSNIPDGGMREGTTPFLGNTGRTHPEQGRAENTYAGFWVRLGAYIIDSIVVFAGLLVVRFVMWMGMSVLDGELFSGRLLFQYTLKDIVLYAAQVLYFILCTYYTGTTLGKCAMNLRVIHADETKKLSFLNVVYRETVGRFLSGIILGIGYIMIGIDKEKRGLHDFLCDTRVVYGRKVKVYPVYRQPVPPYRPVQPQRPVPPPVPPQMTVPPAGNENTPPDASSSVSQEDRNNQP